MPAVNQRQRRLFGMVRAAQKGETPASPQVAKIAASISPTDAKKFAKTKEKNLPESAVPGKPAEKVGALTNIDIPQDEREAAKQRTLAKAKAAREKRMNKEEVEIEEGMSLKDFKANRRKLKRKEASDDAKKRGHVGKEWYNSGRTYSPDEAKSGRANMPDHERSTRHRSAVDPEAEDDNYSADKTKNPKKLRKQKAMGEIKKEGYLPEEDYDRMKDRRMERGGVDGNTRYPSKPSAGKAETAAEKKAREDKQRETSRKALDMVRQSIIAKHGKGALMNSFDAEGETIQEDEYRRLMAQERKAEKEREAKRAGRKSITPGKKAASTGRDYADSNVKFHAKVTGKTTTTEGTFAGNYEGPLYAQHPDLVDESALGTMGVIAGMAAGKAIHGAIEKRKARKDYEEKKKISDGLKLKSKAKRATDGGWKNRTEEVEMVNEMPYQVYGSPDGTKEKKIGKPVKSRKYAADRAAELEDTHKKTGGKYRSEYTEETINERGDFWHPDPEQDRKLGGPGANQRAREDRAAASKPKEDPKKLRKGESYMDYAKRQGYKSTPKEGLRDKLKRKLGLNNSYSPTEGKTYREFMAEGNRTGRMMKKSETQVTGHISADRGDDEKANREKRKGLEKDLKKHGIGHKKGVGEYKYGSGETGREVSYQTSKPEKMSKRRFGKVMRRLGRKHGQESVITKDSSKPAKLHYTEKGSKAKSDSIGKTKAGKHPEGYGETSGTKVRGGKLPKKTTKGAYHYG